ncbi:PDC sensor domain-containing protein [Clostridium sp. LP20]|uniref:PDC sensor domain-containing protein n=1 Tax=Clostridium sp. LP20 TaxID=3418665 RepID=UPI003EE8130E
MRNNNLVKNKRGRNIAIGGTLFITIIIVFFLFIFNNKVNTEIEDIGLNYITDISKEIDANLEIELSKSLNYVKGIAISLSNLDTNFSQYSLNYIDKVSSFTNFDDLFIIDINGMGRKSDGTKINLSDREYFKDAMKGNIGVSDLIVSRINNKEEVVVYAPIYI